MAQEGTEGYVVQGGGPANVDWPGFRRASRIVRDSGAKGRAVSGGKSNWVLEHEIGLRYFANPELEDSTRLAYPIHASRLLQNRILVVDQVEPECCRTLVVDRNTRDAVWDSLACGIPDAFASPLGAKSFLLLRRQDLLLEVHCGGSITHKMSLRNRSQYPPHIAAKGSQKTIIVCFAAGPGDGEICEVSFNGDILRRFSFQDFGIRMPRSVQGIPGRGMLITDEEAHCVIQIDAAGHRRQLFGCADNPGTAPNQLSGPSAVTEVPGGDTLVVDTRNHRIIRLKPSGKYSTVRTLPASLYCPTSIQELQKGSYLVCDAGNRRVIETDARGEIRWSLGGTPVKERLLSFPRSVEFVAPDRFLIADTYNDRVLMAGRGDDCEVLVTRDSGLFWPRCVRSSSRGTLLVADGRNGRVMEVSVDREILRQIDTIRGASDRRFADPHDVRETQAGNLLVTDSALDLVVEVSWGGHTTRLLDANTGVNLSDPHSAQEFDHSRLLVCDSGNDRILVVDPLGQVVHQLKQFVHDGESFPFSRPRYAEITDKGDVVIADTGNNRILAGRLSGQLRWSLSEIQGSPLERLNKPRWVSQCGDRLVITDHYNHRVLVMRSHNF